MDAIITNNISCKLAEKNIAILTISRPKALNAMLMEFLYDAHKILDQLENDESVRCLIITGEGDKSFSSGGDLREEMDNCLGNHEKLLLYNTLGDQMILKIWRSRLPVIAAVNGYSFGAPWA